MLQFHTAAPESVRIPSNRIIHCIDRIERSQVPLHSFLLLRGDRLITECYFSPCQKGDLHRMFSITKSLTGIAIGLLAEEGKLSVDDPIISYFPDKVPADVHPLIAKMTIRDLLMMRSCHDKTTYKFDMTKDWVESFFTTTPSHPAGTIFHLCSPHPVCTDGAIKRYGYAGLSESKAGSHRIVRGILPFEGSLRCLSRRKRSGGHLRGSAADRFLPIKERMH